MNRIAQFLDRFFGTVQQVDCEPKEEEMLDGQAFTYKVHKLDTGPQAVAPTNTITATVNHSDGTVSKVTEYIDKAMVIDAIAIFRAKEAFGMTNVIGAAFGEAKK